MTIQANQKERERAREYGPVIIQRLEKISPAESSLNPGLKNIDRRALPLIAIRKDGAEFPQQFEMSGEGEERTTDRAGDHSSARPSF